MADEIIKTGRAIFSKNAIAAAERHSPDEESPAEVANSLENLKGLRSFGVSGVEEPSVEMESVEQRFQNVAPIDISTFEPSQNDVVDTGKISTPVNVDGDFEGLKSAAGFGIGKTSPTEQAFNLLEQSGPKECLETPLIDITETAQSGNEMSVTDETAPDDEDSGLNHGTPRPLNVVEDWELNEGPFHQPPTGRKEFRFELRFQKAVKPKAPRPFTFKEYLKEWRLYSNSESETKEEWGKKILSRIEVSKPMFQSAMLYLLDPERCDRVSMNEAYGLAEDLEPYLDGPCDYYELAYIDDCLRRIKPPCKRPAGIVSMPENPLAIDHVEYYEKDGDLVQMKKQKKFEMFGGIPEYGDVFSQILADNRSPAICSCCWSYFCERCDYITDCFKDCFRHMAETCPREPITESYCYYCGLNFESATPARAHYKQKHDEVGFG